MKYNQIQENIVDVLCNRTFMQDRGFFRLMVAYKMSEIATNMRCSFNYSKSENIPCNMYALALAYSGYSKNKSMDILDKNIFNGFTEKFIEDTYEKTKDLNLIMLADKLSRTTGCDIDIANKEIQSEFHKLPSYLYQFGASTIEGVKGLRTKLSMAGIGATNNIIDEIGHNIIDNKDTFKLYLDTYDMGLGKTKLIKTDSNPDMRGSVPSNLFAFGTQSRLLDGGNVEKLLFEFLEDGYGRRFMFGYVDKTNRAKLTADEKFQMINNKEIDNLALQLNRDITELANTNHLNKNYDLSEDVVKKVFVYEQECLERAEECKEHENILRAVITHSYWRVLKLACAYAFVEKSDEITTRHIDEAIQLCEDSIYNFQKMLKREKSYVKLAKYIGSTSKEVTQVDLVEDLPFYTGSIANKQELMNLAIAYGYRNNIVIKRRIKDGIEFLSGEVLEETNIDNVHFSWSDDIAYGYKETSKPFNELYKLVTANGLHYTSHSFKDGHRKKDNAIKGFDLLILDVDDGLPIEVCRKLLENYTYLIATTKRHTQEKPRYRIILPTNYKLMLDADTYKKFMTNVFESLPFETDEQTSDISRKWASYNGDYYYSEGELFDVLPYIPDTSKQVEHKKMSNKYLGVDNLQRWFLMNYSEDDGRNNTILKFALALVDNGYDYDTVFLKVKDFNNHFDEPLSDMELQGTVMKTVMVKIIERDK